MEKKKIFKSINCSIYMDDINYNFVRIIKNLYGDNSFDFTHNMNLECECRSDNDVNCEMKN